jgi:hypothetical protein
MFLKHNSTSTNDFSSFPSSVAWCAHLIKPAIGSRQGVCLRQRALTSCLSGPIHIDHDPLPTGSVKQATRRGKRRSCKQVFLKERAERFHWWPIQGRKKAGQSGAMRQPISAKQGHERRGPRSQPFVKRLESWLTGKGIANQHGNKIDQIVMAEASAGKAHLILDRFQDTGVREYLSKRGHFSHPGGHGGLRAWGNLDCNLSRWCPQTGSPLAPAR